MTNAAKSWDDEFARQQRVNQYPKWPNEVMVKLLFGGSDYLETPYVPRPEWRILDIGCGFANNLIPFADIGCECHGIDIHEGIVERARGVMDERGYDMTFTVGSNSSIPYDDDTFDLALSICTLHYQGTAEAADAALAEFRRILKPGGGVLIMTTGPDHSVRRDAVPLGDNSYELGDFDFRSGEEFFFLDTEEELAGCCSRHFDDVETGRVIEKLMKLPLDLLIALCR